MMKKYTIMVTIGIILLVLLAWGLIGSSQVSQIGNTCDFGINDQGSVFCWKWHQNVMGDVQEGFDDLLNN